MRKLRALFDYATGAYRRRWRAAAFRGCGIALVYHRIAPPGGAGEAPAYGVERGLPVDVFEAQLRFACEHFRPARTLDLLAPDPGGVRFSVTFDDGYRDNLVHAAPVLERLGIPATIFVTTDFVGTQRLFWWEQLGELLRATREPALALAEAAPELAASWPLPQRLDLGSAALRERAHWLVSMALMRTPPGEIDGIVARLASALRAPLRQEGRAAPLLDWDDLRRWRALGFVGGHGASHANLGLASDAEVEAEVRRSLDAIARETGAPARLFAYPYGGREHRSPAAARALAAAQVRGAFTTDVGLLGPGSDRFELPRLGLTSASRLKCVYHTQQAFASDETRAAIAAGSAG
jgi:peptidoglycan/xylan/chitin deacetylase (PgdA/CDA1 family)